MGGGGVPQLFYEKIRRQQVATIRLGFPQQQRYAPANMPSALNLQPSTLNPQPSTLNPQPSTFFFFITLKPRVE